MVVVGKSKIGMTITIDVSHCAALGIVAISNLVRLPSGPGILRVLEPPNSISHPAGGHHVGCAIVVHIDRPLPAVRNKLAENTHLSILMPNPLSAIRAWIFVPIASTQEIWPPVAIHINGGDSLSVVRTQTMDSKSDLRNSVGANSRSGF